MNCLLLISLAALPLWGQEPPAGSPPPTPSPPVLENAGKPMLVPFQCSAEDIRSTGLACSEEDPCQVYLELAAAVASGSRMFAAGNIHTESATLYSILLASEDSGHTWREAHERIRGAGLDHLQFTDVETGFATGLALSPLPQDPFLLI